MDLFSVAKIMIIASARLNIQSFVSFALSENVKNDSIVDRIRY